MSIVQKNQLGIVGIVGEASYGGYGVSVIEEAAMMCGAKDIREYETFVGAEEGLRCGQITVLFIIHDSRPESKIQLNISNELVIERLAIEVPLYYAITEKDRTFPGSARLDESIGLYTNNGQATFITNSLTVIYHNMKIIGVKTPGAIVNFIILKKK